MSSPRPSQPFAEAIRALVRQLSIEAVPSTASSSSLWVPATLLIEVGASFHALSGQDITVSSGQAAVTSSTSVCRSHVLLQLSFSQTMCPSAKCRQACWTCVAARQDISVSLLFHFTPRPMPVVASIRYKFFPICLARSVLHKLSFSLSPCFFRNSFSLPLISCLASEVIFRSRPFCFCLPFHFYRGFLCSLS